MSFATATQEETENREKRGEKRLEPEPVFGDSMMDFACPNDPSFFSEFLCAECRVVTPDQSEKFQTHFSLVQLSTLEWSAGIPNLRGRRTGRGREWGKVTSRRWRGVRMVGLIESRAASFDSPDRDRGSRSFPFSCFVLQGNEVTATKPFAFAGSR